MQPSALLMSFFAHFSRTRLCNDEQPQTSKYLRVVACQNRLALAQSEIGSEIWHHRCHFDEQFPPPNELASSPEMRRGEWKLHVPLVAFCRQCSARAFIRGSSSSNLHLPFVNAFDMHLQREDDRD